VVPSVEVRIVPVSPTATYNPLEVVVLSLVVESLFFAHEMKERLKHEISKMYKHFFILHHYILLK
jgi:hypothetical protein